MWSEEMDKKIRAAAENDMHGYEDKAWQNMEVLLEKHLPQKKTRRRIVLFLFFGLLVASVPAFFILKKTFSEKTSIASANNPSAEQKTGEKSNSDQPASSTTQQKPGSLSPANTTSSPGQTGTEISTGTATNSTADKTTTTSNPASNNSLTSAEKTAATNDKVNQKTKTTPLAPGNNKASMSIAIKNSSVASKTKPVPAPHQSQPDKNQPETETQSKADQQKNSTAIDPITKAAQNPVSSSVTAPVKPVTTEVTVNESKAPVKAELTDSTATAMTDKPVKKDKKKNSTASKFSISLSAGPDYSSVASKPGQWRVQYGLGLGYAISKKLSIRTGFYVARKVYTADSNTYKTEFTSGPYNYKLNKIKANCLVYQIPVSVVYNFAKAKSHSWFVSGGVSSYFMKSEKYDYIYTHQNMTWRSQYAVKNKNEYLVATLNLSAGYQYNFNKRLSLMAEPYLGLPLGGVGEGDVKLKSAGVMFTLGYKPFSKR
jgi:hypothetical protein